MENQILNLEKLEDRATTIPFELLSQSIRQEGKLGNILETKPLQIWNLIDHIKNDLVGANINFVPDNIYIQKKSSAALLNDVDRSLGYNRYNAPVNKWKFDKVIAGIDIPNIGSAGVNAKIGITLNDDGIAVAYGMNVHVCQNFNVMGGTVMRTYTFNRVPGVNWEVMKNMLKTWARNLDQIFKVQSETMLRMQEKEIKDERTIQRVIGTLYTNAIKQAYFKGDYTPFDTHALSQFVQEMVKARKEEEKISTVWDLYNWGTSVMKPNIIDTGEISNVSNAYSQFLCEDFKIEVPELVLD